MKFNADFDAYIISELLLALDWTIFVVSKLIDIMIGQYTNILTNMLEMDKIKTYIDQIPKDISNKLKFRAKLRIDIQKELFKEVYKNGIITKYNDSLEEIFIVNGIKYVKWKTYKFNNDHIMYIKYKSKIEMIKLEHGIPSAFIKMDVYSYDDNFNIIYEFFKIYCVYSDHNVHIDSSIDSYGMNMNWPTYKDYDLYFD